MNLGLCLSNNSHTNSVCKFNSLFMLSTWNKSENNTFLNVYFYVMHEYINHINISIKTNSLPPGAEVSWSKFDSFNPDIMNQFWNNCFYRTIERNDFLSKIDGIAKDKRYKLWELLEKAFELSTNKPIWGGFSSEGSKKGILLLQSLKEINHVTQNTNEVCLIERQTDITQQLPGLTESDISLLKKTFSIGFSLKLCVKFPDNASLSDFQLDKVIILNNIMCDNFKYFIASPQRIHIEDQYACLQTISNDAINKQAVQFYRRVVQNETAFYNEWIKNGFAEAFMYKMDISDGMKDALCKESRKELRVLIHFQNAEPSKKKEKNSFLLGIVFATLIPVFLDYTRENDMNGIFPFPELIAGSIWWVLFWGLLGLFIMPISLKEMFSTKKLSHIVTMISCGLLFVFLATSSIIPLQGNEQISSILQIIFSAAVLLIITALILRGRGK